MWVCVIDHEQKLPLKGYARRWGKQNEKKRGKGWGGVITMGVQNAKGRKEGK